MLAEFMSVMRRDIREFDNEKDLKNAWKVLDKVSGSGAGTAEHPYHTTAPQ